MLVEPERNQTEKSEVNLEHQLERLNDIFLPSNLGKKEIENVWLRSAKDFDLALKRLVDLLDRDKNAGSDLLNTKKNRRKNKKKCTRKENRTASCMKTESKKTLYVSAKKSRHKPSVLRVAGARCASNLSEEENIISILAEVFSDVPRDTHLNIFRACQGDIDLTIGQIILMYEDGVVGDGMDAVCLSGDNACERGKLNALDLFQNSYNIGGHSNMHKMERICLQFPGVHPYWTHCMFRIFDGNISKIQMELQESGFLSIPHNVSCTEEGKCTAWSNLTEPRRCEYSRPWRSNLRARASQNRSTDWIFSNALMFFKFQQASQKYIKGEIECARALCSEAERFRFSALQCTSDEADGIFSEYIMRNSNDGNSNCMESSRMKVCIPPEFSV